MASPWAKIQPMAESLSIDEITAEEVVKNIQKREVERHQNYLKFNGLDKEETTDVNNIDNDGIIAQLLQEQYDKGEFKKSDENAVADASEEQKTPSLDDTDSDVVIAHLLQHQYNRDYDFMIKKTEEQVNGRSKVGISLSKFLVGHEVEPEKEDHDKKRDLDRFVSVEKEYASIPRCGYKMNADGSGIVTKHDVLMSSRINACRVLEFPPGISTGDTGGFDVKLNNKVFNSLKDYNHAFCAKQKAKTRPNNNSEKNVVKKN